MTVMVAFFAAYIAVYSITDPSERSVWTDLASVVLLVVMVWVIVAMMEWEYSLHVQRERKHLRDLVPVREG
jgi:glucan phosphoethanolaminetransferase (alkaline phosphatase superfamily)